MPSFMLVVKNAVICMFLSHTSSTEVNPHGVNFCRICLKINSTVALRITLVVYYPRQMAAILPSIQKVFAVPRQHLTII